MPTKDGPDRRTRRNVLVGSLGALAAGSLVGAGRGGFEASAARQGLATRTRAGMAFQTPVALIVAGRDVADLESALDAGFAAIRDIERASSVYRPDGELARLNRAGHLDRPSRHLRTLVRYALHLAQATDGAFDPTVQPLWDIWAAAKANGTRPDETSLRRTLTVVDWRGVSLDDASVRFDRPGMAVTLNSINQGYAADVVMQVLTDRGVGHAFVDTGEFGAHGTHPDGRDWRLGVVAPRDNEALAFTIDPFRRFAATSGDYKTFFSPDFKDHHIFDPKTGHSPPDWSSITVQAPSGLVADGLSTALFTLDEARARTLLASAEGCSARFFTKNGRELAGVT